MGSSFSSVKIRHLSKSKIEKNNKKIKKDVRYLNPPYLIYMLSRFVLDFLWVLKIISINKKTPIKLIHSQDTGYAGLAAIIAKKLLGIPVIISSHGIRHKTLEPSLSGKLSKLLLKIEYTIDVFTAKRADCVITINNMAKKYYENLTKRKIECVPVPIKFTNFKFLEKDREAIRKEFGFSEKTKVIGYVGRLSPEKNLFTLLSSIITIPKDYDLKLMLVGAGPLENSLRNFVIENNIEDKVIFCGLRNDVRRILSALDIFVLPSYTEGLPLAMLEAMAASRAIICSNIAAHQELVDHNKESLLVDPNNQKEFKEAILLLCKNDLLREKLGNNAKLKASQFDEELIFPKILQLYQRLLEKEGSDSK